MKNVVIYTSQTGFTKRYAEWIGEAAEAEAVDLAQAKKLNLRDIRDGRVACRKRPLEGILRQSLFTISRFALLLLPRRL